MEWIGEVEIAKSLGEAGLSIYYWHDYAARVCDPLLPTCQWT